MSEPIVKSALLAAATVDLGKLVEILLNLAYSAKNCKDKSKTLALKVGFLCESIARIKKEQSFDPDVFGSGVLKVQQVFEDAVNLLQRYRNGSMFVKIFKAPFTEDGFNAIHERLDICARYFGLDLQVRSFGMVSDLVDENRQREQQLWSIQQQLEDMKRLRSGDLRVEEENEVSKTVDGVTIEEEIFGGHMMCASISRDGMSSRVLLISSGELGTRESAILKRLSGAHANILQFIGKFVEDKTVYAVMERPGEQIITLDIFIEEHPQLKDGHWSLKKNLALGIAMGIQYAHAAGVLHKNLRSSNVFISDSEFEELLVPKISGFMHGRIKTEPSEKRFQGNEQFRWAAPEMLHKKRPEFNDKCDIFSLGVVLWELLAWSKPFKDIPGGLKVLQARTKQGVRLHLAHLAQNSTDSLNSFIQICEDCMETNAEKRPDADTVVERLSKLIPEDMHI